MKTQEQIARRKAASKARREAAAKPMEVTDHNRQVIEKAVAKMWEAFEAGKLPLKAVKGLGVGQGRAPKVVDEAALKEKIAKQMARLARLEEALKAQA